MAISWQKASSSLANLVPGSCLHGSFVFPNTSGTLSKVEQIKKLSNVQVKDSHDGVQLPARLCKCVCLVVQEQQPPEVSRTPLEQLCLTVKTRFGDDHKLASVLRGMLTPPDAPAIQSAVQSLSNLGALDADEGLTALGRLLTQVPMDPRLAKTCIFACMLR